MDTFQKLLLEAPVVSLQDVGERCKEEALTCVACGVVGVVVVVVVVDAAVAG